MSEAVRTVMRFLDGIEAENEGEALAAAGLA